MPIYKFPFLCIYLDIKFLSKILKESFQQKDVNHGPI